MLPIINRIITDEFLRRQQITRQFVEKFTHRRPVPLSGPAHGRSATPSWRSCSRPGRLPVTSARVCATAATRPAPSTSASIGSVTVQDRQLYRLALRPQFPLGRAAVVLDLELFLGEDGSVQSLGWSFATPAETFDSLLRKIYYVRYGKPRDPAFVRAGALDRVTLGYGLIMDRYRNTLEYPGIKRTGAVFHFDRLAGNRFGLQGMIGNVQDFQQGGALLGTRLFTYVGERVELGATYVLDTNQCTPACWTGTATAIPTPSTPFPRTTCGQGQRRRRGPRQPRHRRRQRRSDRPRPPQRAEPQCRQRAGGVGGRRPPPRPRRAADEPLQQGRRWRRPLRDLRRRRRLPLEARRAMGPDLVRPGGDPPRRRQRAHLRQARVQNVASGNRRAVGLGSRRRA